MPGKPKPMLNRPRGKVSDLRKKFNPRTGEETNKPGGKDPRTIYKPEAQIPPERQMRTGGRLRIGTYQNPTSERSKESIDNYVRGMRKNRSFQYKKNDRGKIIKIELNTGGLSAKQKKLAAKAPPPDKLDAKDFAVLKKEKAKGRGMGLQDESIKPGKVMKAKRGHFSESNVSGHKRVMGVFPKVSGAPKNLNKAFMKTIGVLPTINKVTPTVKGKELPKASDAFMKRRLKLSGTIGTGLGIASMMVPAAYGLMKQYKDNKAAKNRDEAKVKKMAGGMAKKYSVGGGADMGAKRDIDDIPSRRSRQAYAIGESMRDRDRLTTRDIQEATKALKPSQRKSRRYAATPGNLPKPAIGKMGGGMMQRPMGYKSGTMVKARGCKLGRTRPTKMY